MFTAPHRLQQLAGLQQDRDSEGEGANLTPPRRPARASTVRPPHRPAARPLSSCLLSLIISRSSPRSFSSFQPSAQACLRLLARVIACQGSAQGTEGWDSHSPVSLARMAHPEAWKGLREPLGPQRGCV